MQLALPATGELNRRAQIRLQTDVPNAAYGVDQTFSTGIARWAKRDPVHGLALRGAAQTDEAPTDLFWFRWGTGTKPADLTTAHVIECEGNRFRVLDAIDVQNLRRFTRVTAKCLGAI